MALAFFTPFLRGWRQHRGITRAEAALPRPGDALVPAPRFSWTHAIEVEAPAHEVWPWVAQLGADRAGFYSYQWLENLAGCELRNAETVHPEWALRQGDALSLHPRMPSLRVVLVEPGRHLVAYGAPDERAKASGEPWLAASWAFLVEPLGDRRCRLISRFRSDYSDHLVTRLTSGALLLEPIGATMDRKLLRGIKQRAEQRAREALLGEARPARP